ncbi:hypothetical protein B0T17DRAFT_621606 [Bombardia bombarda]|uniref:Vitelline coat lysin M7 n=1 Tax=Bombardia bombarda TaxID=252184 RepID=A0AA39T0K7_9PEZI|nr:hypothetical protein B0T17DRAFT_621606 [Bombardia bombarda]
MSRKLANVVSTLFTFYFSSFTPRVLATRPCGVTIEPFPWTISEWTYDGPDTSLQGRASTDAVVGMYLTTDRSQYSCLGMWPEPWGGRTEDGKAVLWHACINNFQTGKLVDEEVSFALDWKKRILYAAHLFVCGDGDRNGVGTLFSLRNTATNDTFQCSGPNQVPGSDEITGSCTTPRPHSDFPPKGNGTTSASFHFNTDRRILTVKQSWVCNDSDPPEMTHGWTWR